MPTQQFIQIVKERKMEIMQEVEALDRIIFMHEGTPAKPEKKKVAGEPKPRNKRITTEDAATVRQLILQGKSNDEIANKYIATYPNIKDIAHYIRLAMNKAANAA